jgi:tRNA modification GTPase
MIPADHDTIAAIATAPGLGGIGIVRVSGDLAGRITERICGRVPDPRRAQLSVFRGGDGRILDEGLALWFPAPQSYTGEAVLELHGHGGPVVLQSVLSACLDAGARVAGPGEFTRRAYLNGRLDLAQAEAVADLIEAATSDAARGALRSLSGEFSSAVGALVTQLTELRTLIEAMLDFPEEDIDATHREAARTRLLRVSEALEAVHQRSRQGSLLRSGINVVLAGKPNVGKSSLLNRLTGEDRAIVTPVPGTTRDVLRELIQIEGVPLHIIDTAGLRDSNDEIERIGMERTWREVARADVVLVLFDAVDGSTLDDQAILARLPPGAVRIHVYNKIDLVGLAPARIEDEPVAIRLSAKTGEGVDLLRAALLHAAGWRGDGETVFLARERHLRALSLAGGHLATAGARLEHWELFAEELRLAQLALGEIVGEFSADDLLGEIFSRFCIGK